jgi:hypothetical protein
MSWVAPRASPDLPRACNVRETSSHADRGQERSDRNGWGRRACGRAVGRPGSGGEGDQGRRSLSDRSWAFAQYQQRHACHQCSKERERRCPARDRAHDAISAACCATLLVACSRGQPRCARRSSCHARVRSEVTDEIVRSVRRASSDSRQLGQQRAARSRFGQSQPHQRPEVPLVRPCRPCCSRRGGWPTAPAPGRTDRASAAWPA